MCIHLNVCPRMTQPNLELGFACSFPWCNIHPQTDKPQTNRKAHQGTYTRFFVWESVYVSLVTCKLTPRSREVERMLQSRSPSRTSTCSRRPSARKRSISRRRSRGSKQLLQQDTIQISMYICTHISLETTIYKQLKAQLPCQFWKGMFICSWVSAIPTNNPTTLQKLDGDIKIALVPFRA